MVEKNSGVPSLNEVAALVQQPEQPESVPDVGTTTPHTKRTRKSKIKPDTENDTVANKDSVNAEQSNLPPVAAGNDVTPVPAVGVAAPAESAEPVVAKTVEVANSKPQRKRPRPYPPIEHIQTRCPLL